MLQGPLPLQGGDHAGDGVVEGGFVVEIGLPEAREKLQIVFPAAFIEAFADGVGWLRFSACGRRASDVGLDGVIMFLRSVVGRCS